ncbi:ORF96 [Ranid herpesvirus 1]|uniref:ORF96 n=1 Tax=Ranid herpesvirus 1 TaxID=85655 RepID=Q14VN4_9VIRU|nr:ORF96 [Ranid herpesvirus 1]ABG25802.1 ORF96 [Ranid herpesvirus 1]
METGGSDVLSLVGERQDGARTHTELTGRRSGCVAYIPAPLPGDPHRWMGVNLETGVTCFYNDPKITECGGDGAREERGVPTPGHEVTRCYASHSPLSQLHEQCVAHGWSRPAITERAEIVGGNLRFTATIGVTLKDGTTEVASATAARKRDAKQQAAELLLCRLRVDEMVQTYFRRM